MSASDDVADEDRWQASFAPSVDAPAGARKIVKNERRVGWGAAICPASDAAGDLPRARMGVREPSPNQSRVLEARWCKLASWFCLSDPCARLSFRPTLRLRRPLDRER